jgi:hypothetical protein
MLLTDLYHVPIWLSLGMIGLVLAVSVIASLGKPSPRRYGEDVPVPDPMGLLTKRSGTPDRSEPAASSPEGKAG